MVLVWREEIRCQGLRENQMRRCLTEQHFVYTSMYCASGRCQYQRLGNVYLVSEPRPRGLQQFKVPAPKELCGLMWLTDTRPNEKCIIAEVPARAMQGIHYKGLAPDISCPLGKKRLSRKRGQLKSKLTTGKYKKVPAWHSGALWTEQEVLSWVGTRTCQGAQTTQSSGKSVRPHPC